MFKALLFNSEHGLFLLLIVKTESIKATSLKSPNLFLIFRSTQQKLQSFRLAKLC